LIPSKDSTHNDDGFNSATQELVRVWNEFTEVLLMTLLLTLLSLACQAGLGILSSTTKGRSDKGAFLMFDQIIHDALAKDVLAVLND
jgi:hypothetical protein